MSIQFPVKLPVLKGSQDLGDYYIALIPVDILLEVAYSDPFREEKGTLTGIQRREAEDRRRAIRDYIVSDETVFPNSLVLGANYNKHGFLEIDIEKKWRVESDPLCPSRYLLVIPTNEALASIIDGQHRLGGFKELAISHPEDFQKQKIDLLCSIYLDLPTADQAYIFATINSTQKKVEKSLAYELYGFNLTSDPQQWSPEKLAISLTRRLNIDPKSPLQGRIPIRDQSPKRTVRSASIQENWSVSTAAVVDGILRLITSDAARDRNIIGIVNKKEQKREKAPMDSSPLRKYYLETDDALTYAIIVNFFDSVKDNIWNHHSPRSYIFRTVGFQALFDLLYNMLPYMIEHRDLRKAAFDDILSPLRYLDFNEAIFENANAIGRGRISNALMLATGFRKLDEIHGNAIPKLADFFAGQGFNLNSVPHRKTS